MWLASVALLSAASGNLVSGACTVFAGQTEVDELQSSPHEAFARALSRATVTNALRRVADC